MIPMETPLMACVIAASNDKPSFFPIRCSSVAWIGTSIFSPEDRKNAEIKMPVTNCSAVLRMPIPLVSMCLNNILICSL